MSNLTTSTESKMLAVESALVRNDISKLTTEEKKNYYNALCESVGLNPLTKPFAFLTLQGREVLYATKDCSEQLRKIHGVSTQVISEGVVGDLYEVRIKAGDRSGRVDEDMACIPLGNAKGAELANIKMKCITKAKRRVTLSICGLGMLDESELDTIESVQKAPASNPQIPTFKELVSSLDNIKVKRINNYVFVGGGYDGKSFDDILPEDFDAYLSKLESVENKNQAVTSLIELMKDYKKLS